MNLPANAEARIRSAIRDIPRQFPEGGSDKKWTDAVKIALGELGEELGFDVCTAGVEGRFDHGWLFDLTWYKNSDKRQLRFLPLIAESEWKMDYESLRFDFEKLLVGKAKFKVMVFQAKGERAREHIRRLKDAILTYEGQKEGEIYLLACYDDDEGEFLIENA